MTNPNMNPTEILLRPTAYEPENKAEFHRVAKRLLKKLHKRLEQDGTYGKAAPIRSNMGGIAVSGEITLHCERLYVQVSQSTMGPQNGIMFRECAGLEDYVGGKNHFAPLTMLDDTEELAKLIQTKCSFWINSGQPEG